MSNKAEQMRKLAAEFNDDDSFTGGYRHRWEAIVMYRKWCRLTGDFHSVDSASRFLEFVGREDE